MQIELALDAIADAAYDTSYHHKLRGRLWRAFANEDTYSDVHDTDHGIGFSFSNVYPWGNVSTGDRRYLRVSSPRQNVLDDLVTHFGHDKSFDIGQMRFRVEEISGHALDVGEPGSTGLIDTATGVFCALNKERAEDYDVDTTEMTAGDSETRTFWLPKHGMGPLRETIKRSLQQIHELFGDSYYDGPMEVDEPLFEEVEPIKDEVTYSISFQPTTAVDRTVILSKWRFGYRVRDETHRYHLNLALDSGIGQRREHGFGFLNLLEQTPPRAETP